MSDLEKKENLDSTEVESSFVADVNALSGIEYERAQLLQNLPDPDAGKTEEERKAIVRSHRPND